MHLLAKKTKLQSAFILAWAVASLTFAYAIPVCADRYNISPVVVQTCQNGVVYIQNCTGWCCPGRSGYFQYNTCQGNAQPKLVNGQTVPCDSNISYPYTDSINC
jgi:hypothetical protein